MKGPIFLLARVLLLGVLLASCSDGSNSNSSSASGAGYQTPPSEDPVDPVDPVDPGIGTAGGIIRIEDPDSPIYGASVLVLPGSVAEGTVDILLDYEEELPGPLADSAILEDYVVLSKTIVLTKNVDGTFEKSLEITVPYDADALNSNDVPSVFYWDPETGEYEAVAVVSIDPDAGMLTFRTVHFSKYIVIGIRGLGNVLGGDPAEESTIEAEEPSASLSVDTGFKPSQDGFFIANISSYSSPGGNCLGMASYADWYFEKAKQPLNSGIGLQKQYLQGDPSRESDDFIAKELIVRAHAAASQEWDSRLLERFSKLGEIETGKSLIQNMKLLGKPQIFIMYGNPSWFEKYIFRENSWGHALVVYSYDNTSKTFGLYDPNFRGEDFTIAFDGTGFGGFSKSGVYNSPAPDLFAYDSASSIYSPQDLRALHDGAAKGWEEGEYGSITLTEPTVDEDNTIKVDVTENIVISGEVVSSGGIAGSEPNRLDVYVAGSLDGSAEVNSGSFTYTIAKLPNPAGGDIHLVAYKSKKIGNRTSSIYGTFKYFRIEQQVNSIENIGFELGSFEHWFSERHTLRDSTQIVPSDKSTIAIGGFDPIATDVRTVLFGEYSARVNNSDNSYHVSTITREIVIPEGAESFPVSFNWAAVLQDPNHTPEDQPYVNVVVTNLTTGTVLYKKRFYSNDPSYLGWKSYQGGGWKAIDWQNVSLGNLAEFGGDTIQIYVEAADCDRGGHGGYAYYDAEE